MLKIGSGWAYTDNTWESQVGSPNLRHGCATMFEIDSATRLSDAADSRIDKTYRMLHTISDAPRTVFEHCFELKLN